MSPCSVRILYRVLPRASSSSGALFGSKHALLQRSWRARSPNVRHSQRPRGDAAASGTGCLHRRIPNALPAPQITNSMHVLLRPHDIKSDAVQGVRKNL